MLCVLVRIASSNTQYTIFNIKKKITLNYPKSAAMGFCAKGLKNEFETVVINEQSVFEPLKFYYRMCVSFDIKFIKRDQKQRREGTACYHIMLSYRCYHVNLQQSRCMIN